MRDHLTIGRIGMRRHIIIGDIHGCADALFTLLDACERTPEDEVVSVGDLVDRGPDPTRVVRFFMDDPNASAILGNHEDKHLRVRDKELLPASTQVATRLLMGDFYDQALDWFATLPLSLWRAGHFICHGGVDPTLPLDQQPRRTLLRGPASSKTLDGERWMTAYTGDVPVIYGHRSVGQVHVMNNTFGIDTGAGGGKDDETIGATELTAMILPERRFVTVPAPDSFVPELRRERGAEFDALTDWYAARHASAHAKAPPQRAAAIMVEGVAITGGWLMQELGLPPGRVLGDALKTVARHVADGTIVSLADVRRLLAPTAPPE